jgi:hypothetical protein
MKTSELTGAALDWAVAKCEGWPMDIWYDEEQLPMIRDDEVPEYKPSTDWAQGGPIIEREKLWVGYSASGSLLRLVVMEDAVVQCHKVAPPCSTTGPTVLIAAMRCYVASKLGNEIELPKELK